MTARTNAAPIRFDIEVLDEDGGLITRVGCKN